MIDTSTETTTPADLVDILRDDYDIEISVQDVRNRLRALAQRGIIKHDYPWERWELTTLEVHHFLAHLRVNR